MLSFMMIAYHLYEGYCRDNLSKIKKKNPKPNQNIAHIYSKFSNSNQQDTLSNSTDPDKPHFKLNNLKVEEI
jgi:hypothetical protein